MSILEFITNHFGHAFPILISGIFGIAIVIERIITLYYRYPLNSNDEFFKKISEFINQGKLPEAQAHCDKYSESPIAKIAGSALSRAHLPETVIEDGLQISVSQSTQAIQKRTAYLATIANVATLLGLLGTILGLIHSFEAVGHADAQQKSALLSAGIATSMNATLLGLSVAIPCMVAYSIIINQSNRLISESENAAVRILDILKQRFYFSADNSENGRRSA